jgi:hypothetical protein
MSVSVYVKGGQITLALWGADGTLRNPVFDDIAAAFLNAWLGLHPEVAKRNWILAF